MSGAVREPPPAVSILVPAHDAGAFLRPTVESALAQEGVALELILVDDGSTDGSVDGIAGRGEPRLRILRQECRGAAAALNAAAAVARGRYLALLDHDDLWLPGKLAAQLEELESHSGSDFSFCWTRFVDERGADLDLPVRRWRGPISAAELLLDYPIQSTSAIVVRREAFASVGGFDPALPRVCDLDLALRIARLRPGNCCAVPEVFNLYRRHPAQMSRDWRGVRGEWQRLLAKVAAWPDGPDAAVRAVADSNMQRYFAWVASEQGEFRVAAGLLAGAIRRAPAHALGESRNALLALGIAAGLVLSASAHDRLRRLAGRALARRR